MVGIADECTSMSAWRAPTSIAAVTPAIGNCRVTEYVVSTGSGMSVRRAPLNPGAVASIVYVPGSSSRNP